MPLYDFRCEHCGLTEEVLMRTTQFDEFSCSCGGGSMQRLPAAPAVHFKGRGWTGKHHHRGLRADWKSSEDTFEETEDGRLRPKTGAGHNTP